MILVYFSLTGNVKKFVNNTGFESYEISNEDSIMHIDKEYVLVVPSYENESITEIVDRFIEYGDNLQYLVGIAGSGNINFDQDYLITAKRLSEKYNTPIIFDFEFMGTDIDIESFKKEVVKLEEARICKEE